MQHRLKRLHFMIGMVGLAVLHAAPQPQENPDTTFHAAPKTLPAGAVTSDWGCVLGPTHNMVSPETKLLKEFLPGKPMLVWEMKKGDGFAAPAVVGDRLILFHRIGNEEVVDCLQATDGRRYWRFSYPTDYHDRYGYNHGPRCSPVVTDDAVFTFGAAGKLHCLDLQTGMVRWQHEILKEYKVPQNFFGVGAAPLVEGNKLIVNIGAAGGPCVVAFDIHTGKPVWETSYQWGPSYATPISALIHGRRRILAFVGGESQPPTGGLLCLDSSSGQIDFAFPWRGPQFESVNASTPVVVDNQVFISECYGSGGALLDVLAVGGTKLVWTNREFGTHFMTAIAQDGYLYGVDGHGPRNAHLVCVNIKNGKEMWRVQPHWQETVDADNHIQNLTFGTYLCTLLAVDGRCLCLGEFGHLLWLDLSPKGYRELARTRLFTADQTWSPPVLSRGLLYICQNTRGRFPDMQPRLLCYDLRGEE